MEERKRALEKRCPGGLSAAKTKPAAPGLEGGQKRAQEKKGEKTIPPCYGPPISVPSETSSHVTGHERKGGHRCQLHNRDHAQKMQL